MHVYRGYHHLKAPAPCALAIGKFDGVHRGHAELLAAMRRAAQRQGLCVSLLTFTPNPREFFARRGVDGAPPLPLMRLSSFRDKVTALRHAGVEQLVVQRFDEAFACMSAEAFIHQVLVQGLNVRLLMVGDDFCFGADRRGDVALLRAAGVRYGFQVKTIAAVTHEGARISSSAIRNALSHGNVALARQMLGARQ